MAEQAERGADPLTPPILRNTWMRRGLAVACVVLLAAAISLKLLASIVVFAPAGVTLSGGCPPSNSSYLNRDAQLQVAAITYCGKRDADTGSISLSLAQGVPAHYVPVVAGYIDGQSVRLQIRSPADGDETIEVTQSSREHWRPINLAFPASWQGKPLQITVVDAGHDTAQWAGLGLIGPPAPAKGAWRWILALAALTAVAALGLYRADADRCRPRLLGGLAAFVLAVCTFVGADDALRSDVAGTWSHPDEMIPVKTLLSMHKHHDLNVDWARADLPQFAAFRYNFAGYILASYLSAKVADRRVFLSERELLNHLLDVSRWCSAATLVLCLLFLLRRTRLPYALAGTLLVAVIPQLLQDAHYARPEAMSTLLATLTFCVATLRPQRMRGRYCLMFVVAGFAGLLASIKFTYAVFLVFCAVLAWALSSALPSRRLRLRQFALFALVAGAGFVVCFSLAAPSVIGDLPGFLAGIQALGQQYGGGHPPHGSHTTSPASQLATVGSYYGATIGLPLLVLHLAGYARSNMAPAKYAFAICAGVTLISFLTQKVFFERNFSVFLPAFVLVAVAGLDNLERAARKCLQRPASQSPPWLCGLLVVVLLAAAWPAASTSLRLAPYFSSAGLAAKQERHQQRLRQAATSIGATGIERIEYAQVVAGLQPPVRDRCVLLEGISFNDESSDRYYRELSSRLMLLRRLPSEFDDVAVSTLHTYYSATSLLFYDPLKCTRHAGTAGP